MSSNETLYKIQRLSDGLFSTGGYTPRFTKTGKSWKLGALLNHLTMIRQNRIRTIEYGKRFGDPTLPNARQLLTASPDFYVGCVIVTFRIVIESSTPIGEFEYDSGKKIGDVAADEEKEFLERCAGKRVRSSRAKLRGE